MNKQNLNKYVLSLVFSDGNQTRYVIQRKNFYEAKQEALEIKDNWNDNGVFVDSYTIKEIKE